MLLLLVSIMVLLELELQQLVKLPVILLSTLLVQVQLQQPTLQVMVHHPFVFTIKLHSFLLPSCLLLLFFQLPLLPSSLPLPFLIFQPPFMLLLPFILFL